MSPEQALGKPLNQRSDLFSLGIVLYELAAGVHPFRGETQAAICNEIIHNDPPSIIRMNPLLPSQFDGFFQRALEKDPECRFQTAADMRATLVQIQRKLQQDSSGDQRDPEPIPSPWPKRVLRIGVPLLLVLAILFTWNPAFLGRVSRLLGISNLPEKRWVAVFPFEVVCSEEDDQGPFVEGLRLDLEGELLRLSRQSQSFRVIPFRHADEINSAREAGRELGVNLVLTGTFTCQGQNGFVYLTLISTEDDALVEAERIDGSLEDRHDLAARTRRSARAMLHLRIPVASTGTLAAGRDLEGIFLEGKGFLFRSDDPESLKSAVERFEKVVEEVPDFAPAYAGLAEAFRHLYNHQPRPEWIQKGKDAADLAVALDSQSPDSFIAKGWMLIEFGEWEMALEAFDRALELAPEEANALRGRAAALDAGDRPDEAAQVFEQAIELYPDDWTGYHALALHYFDLGDYQKALDNFQIVSSLLPDSSVAANNVAAAYLLLERYGLAESVLRTSIEKKDSYYAHNLLGTCLYRQERYEEAAEEYEKALELEDSEWDLWGNLAGTYRLLSLHDEAERCYREGIRRLEDALEVNPEDADLRLDYADYLLEAGDTDESLRQIELVEALPELDRNPWLMYLIGQVYEKRGQRQVAIDWVIKALENGWSRNTVESSPTMRDFVRDPEWIRRAELIENPN
jgi:tetratricopeptide (TPR) repeat protein